MTIFTIIVAIELLALIFFGILSVVAVIIASDVMRDHKDKEQDGC